MMHPSRRILGPFALAPVLAIAVAASTLAAGATYTYTLSGFETSATSTVGTFVGIGTAADDAGTWSAPIAHTVLTNGTATITGGTFDYDGTVRSIDGTFDGGSLTQTGGLTGCTNQTYNVTGSLTLTVPGSGTGTFSAILTHYRIRLFGQCFVYAATVKGVAAFTF